MSKKKEVHLPERKYFKLEELASEWKTEAEHILELFKSGRLMPSVYLPVISGEWIMVTAIPGWDAEIGGFELDGLTIEQEVNLDPIVPEQEGYWYLPVFSLTPITKDKNGQRFIPLASCLFCDKQALPDRDSPVEWFQPLPNSKSNVTIHHS